MSAADELREALAGVVSSGVTIPLDEERASQVLTQLSMNLEQFVQDPAERERMLAAINAAIATGLNTQSIVQLLFTGARVAKGLLVL